LRLPIVQSLFGIAASGALVLLPTGAGVPARQDNRAVAVNHLVSQSASQTIVLTPAIKAALNPGTIGPFPAEKPKTALEALANAIFPHPARKQGPELAYAPEATSPLPGTDGAATDAPKTDLPKPAELAFPPRPDAAAIREALDAYRKNDFVRGDAAALNASDPLARTALEWAALRLQPRPAGFARLIAFADQHPQWPSDSFMRARAEDALYGDKNLAQARTYFARHTPVSASGRLAKARLLIADKHTKEAAALVAQVWRNEDIGAWTETALKKDFGDLLTVQDHKFRSDRLFYKEKFPASLRAAAFVSPDYVALAKARNAVANEDASDKLMEAVPKTMRSDPTYLFARPGSRRRDDDRARQRRGSGQRRRLVDRAPAHRPQAARRKRRHHGLAHRRRPSRSIERSPHRSGVPRRMDRAALPQRSHHGAWTFRGGVGHRPNANLARQGRLLAGTCG
jgi:hypothetical protein